MAIGNLYFIAAIAVVGGGLFGFDISSMSAIIETKAYLCYFDQGPVEYNDDGSRKCHGPSASVQGGITASMAAGSWLGSLLSGFISDFLGRRTAIQIGSVIWYALDSMFPHYHCSLLNMVSQVHWIHHCLRLSEHSHADRWSYHQRSECWYLLCSGAGVHFRDCMSHDASCCGTC